MEEKVSVNDFSLFYALDRGVGQVVAALKKSGLYKNTVLIFSSDNGGNVRTVSNFPLGGEKGCLYEGGVSAVCSQSSPQRKLQEQQVNDYLSPFEPSCCF